MNVIFAGTPEFAAVALEALYAAGHTVTLVLTQPDRPAGRGMQLQPSAVKRCALAHGTPVAQPQSLRLDGKYPDAAQAAHDLLLATPHDVMVVAAYGLILPAWVLALPRHGCINVHASLLPRWRGAAPIHRAIEAGDAETGITIMQMDEGLDTGSMLLSAGVPITDDDSTGSLHDKLATLGGQLLVAALDGLAAGLLPARPQPAEGVTYAVKISKEEAALDFTLPAQQLARKVRAFNPAPGASARCGDVVLKIWQATPLPATSAPGPGNVVQATAQDGVLVACGEGALRLEVLQKPGGKRLPAAEFLQGFALDGRRFD